MRYRPAGQDFGSSRHGWGGAGAARQNFGWGGGWGRGKAEKRSERPGAEANLYFTTCELFPSFQMQQLKFSGFVGVQLHGSNFVENVLTVANTLKSCFFVLKA